MNGEKTAWKYETKLINYFQVCDDLSEFIKCIKSKIRRSIEDKSKKSFSMPYHHLNISFRYISRSGYIYIYIFIDFPIISC